MSINLPSKYLALTDSAQHHGLYSFHDFLLSYYVVIDKALNLPERL